MSLTGLFFVLFLIVHLSGNFLLLAGDGGRAFNHYADFMAHNGLIQALAWIIKLLFAYHAVVGLLLWRQNRLAKGQRYAVRVTDNTGFAARNMIWWGILLGIFLVVHLQDFWFKMHYGPIGMKDGVKDLASVVYEEFSETGEVIFYVVCMLALGLHLWHGFDSAFQTLGARHRKYDKLVRVLGFIFSIGLMLGFASIPVIIYLTGH